MERVWREAPMAALRIVCGTGLTIEPNAAALRWGADAGVTAAHWQELGERLAQTLPSGTDEHCVVIGPQAVTLQARRVALDDGALIWLRQAESADADPARQRMARALDLAGVTVWRIDLAAQRVYFDTIGIPLQGLLVTPQGLPLAEFRHFVHPDDLAAIEQAADAAIASDHIVDAEARYRVAPDEWRPLLTRRVAVRDAAGRATALIGIAIDVSQRHAERAQAEALAEQARMVAQALGLGFWLRHGEGEAVLWDAQMYRLYGRAPERPPPLIAEWLAEYVHPQDRERARRMLDEDIAAWAPSTLMTVRLLDGERWVRAWTRRSVRDDGQRVALGMHQDVTEQRRLEQMQGEAERAARVSREKSAFMALMSHRLRTPLNAVLGFAQLMQQDVHDPIALRQRERLARIDAAGHELLAMIDDVFELASLDAEAAPAPRVPVSLAQVAAQVREAVEPLARQRGVQLSTDFAAALAPVATDRRLLCQALVHLVAHSVRRNPPGGWVALQAAADSTPGWCLLSVSDGGPQLSAAQRELMFEAPAQPALMPADGPADGDPLIGLDLVRHVLERLGAQIDWQAAEARGAGVVLRLPLAEPGPAAAPAPPALKLLCIEDNPVNLMLVQELVAMRPGIQFFSAPDGLSGLALAAAERPDAVLLDLQLPDIGGHEVLARLRADPALAGCTVIALSANALPEQIRTARALGFDDYWTKPIDFDRFLAGLDGLAPFKAPAAP